MSLLLLGAGLGSGETIGRNLWWVGGAASWNGTAGSKWSFTSGGAGGQAEPTLIDNVFFDANSGAVTVTIATVTANCRNIDFTGFTGTFSGATAINIYGSTTLVAGMTRSYTGAITFKSTFRARTITLNGKTLASIIVFDGVGGEWTLQDNFTTTGTVTLTNGSFITGGKTISSSTFSGSNSNLRNLDITNSTITCSGGGWSFSTSTNLIMTTTGSTINVTNSGFAGGGLSYNNVNMTGITGTSNLSGANAYTANLSLAGGAGYGGVLVAATQTVSGVFTTTGNNANSQRLFVASNSLGAAVSIVCNGSAVLTNTDFELIAASGSASFSGTSLGDCTGNTGITFTTPVTRYVVHPGGSVDFMSTTLWSASSGGSTGASSPLPQDTVVMNGSSFPASATITVATAYRMPGLDFTNATNSPTFNLSVGGVYSFFGDLVFISAMTLSGSVSGTMHFRRFGINTSITSAGKTLPGNVKIECNAANVNLNDAVIVGNTITLVRGTWNDNNFSVTTAEMNISGSTTRSMSKGTATYTITGTGSLWDATTTTGLTFSDVGTIKLTNNSAASKSFTGGSLTYNNYYNATLSTGIVTLTSSSTFNDFKIDPGRTQQFSSATTTTLATLTATGTIGNVITMAGNTAANYNMVSSSGTPINTDYIAITHCQFSGAIWHAGVNSTDNGNNTGILFP